LDNYTRALELKIKQSTPQKKQKSSGEVKMDSKTTKEELTNKFHKLLTYHYSKEGEPYIEAHVDMVYTSLDSNDKIGLPKLDDPEMGGVGGWLLFRMFPCVRLVIAIRQDKVIFIPKQWMKWCG
jgi:hypothetical protein